MDSKYALGQVASKEQNLTTLFNKGENSQGLRNYFVRIILWMFEDIHMLVGSNMPIFEEGCYPAVSLRLRSESRKTWNNGLRTIIHGSQYKNVQMVYYCSTAMFTCKIPRRFFLCRNNHKY
uniref:EDRF1 N-terminal domain-containing protein n=1 Tax=Hucho hucho TaxID=62062 RepID=A0A4W5MGM3_9TELE